MAKVGDMVEFLGYSEEVDPDEDVLVVGEHYKVLKVDAKTKAVLIQVDNPEFDEDADESDDNPRYLEVDAFANEVQDVATKAKPAAKTAAKAKAPARAKAPEVEEEAEEEAEAEEEKPVAKAKAKAKPAAKAKEEAKPATKAKPAAKAAAKTKPAAKAKAKPAPVEATEAEEDDYEALDNEDNDIVELVEGTEDILALAEELVEEGAALDYKLGGVLFHIRSGKAYRTLDERYAEKGGFALYVKEHLNMEYRKAMYLVDIYYKFNLFGISGDKVAEIGWTKASKIARVMNETNAEELVELAETASVSELSDSIKESYVEEGGTAGEKKRKITFKFRLWEDQAKAVEEVLMGAAEAMGFKDVADAFEHIVMEWAAEHPLTAPEEAPAKAPNVGKVAAKAKPAAKAKAAAGR